MDARPTFTGFGIDREHSRYHHASPDDAPILDGFFKKMLDELYDGVYFVNSERRILYWNAAAERLSGYTAAEVVGSLCFDNILDHTEAEGCHLCHERCPLAATMQSRKHSANVSFSSTRREIGSQWRCESHRSWTLHSHRLI